MLSPVTRMNQFLQSPTRKMEDITTPARIGHPSPPKLSNDKENDEARKSSVLAPALLGFPGKSNYHERTGLVHCLVTRSGKGKYQLSFQTTDSESVSLIASKVKTSRTANYHIFDALRGGAKAKLTKKSGHYMGKLRQVKGDAVGCYTLFNSSREQEQIAAFVYDIPALMSQVTGGQPPRKMQAVIPKPSANASKSPNNRLMEHLHNGTWKHHDLVAVQTRMPKYHEGQYRLNFCGRVLTPSVKNMQLENENGDTMLQFGKVDDNTFHLDYKAPFTAFSAFAAALCQFDL